MGIQSLLFAGLNSTISNPDTDPDFPYVSLLLKMEGANGSTSFVDSSSNANAVSVSGSAQISTAQSKFGGSSAYFDGTGDWLSCSSSALWQILGGDSTVEFWCYPQNTSSNQAAIEFYIDVNNRWNISFATNIDMFTVVAGSGSQVIAATAPAINTWHHIALVKSGSTFTLYVNGASAGSSTTTNYITGVPSLYIGSGATGSNFQGYIDEVRITKGIARYTTAFTPPTAAFPTTQATDVVTSGLTLYLDAGNAASYPGTGTTWTDLSGNGNNGTLVNGVGYSSANGGFFAFAASNNNYVNFSTYSQPAYSTETSFTWDLWVYPKSNIVGPIMGNRGTDLQFTKLMVTNFSYYNHISGTDNKLGDGMPLNTWQHICIVKDGTNFYYYRNSVLIDSNTSSITKPSRPFWVGADPTAGEGTDTNIASVAVYSRALTDAEIAQNFNALRERFGL